MTKIVGKSGSKNLNLKVGNNNKDIGSENLELRRTSRKIQPTSKVVSTFKDTTHTGLSIHEHMVINLHVLLLLTIFENGCENGCILQWPTYYV